MSRRLDDPVFDGMKVINLPNGTVLITCGCWRLKPAPRDPARSRKHAKGNHARVDSLAAASHWARDHLHSSDHVPLLPDT